MKECPGINHSTLFSERKFVAMICSDSVGMLHVLWNRKVPPMKRSPISIKMNNVFIILLEVYVRNRI